MRRQTLFGRLGPEALPLYSAVAASGALVTIGGGLAVVALVTWAKAWR